MSGNRWNDNDVYQHDFMLLVCLSALTFFQVMSLQVSICKLKTRCCRGYTLYALTSLCRFAVRNRMHRVLSLRLTAVILAGYAFMTLASLSWWVAVSITWIMRQHRRRRPVADVASYVTCASVAIV